MTPLVLVLIIAGLALLDRLLLRLERRGLVYWRRSSPGGGSVGGAMLSVHAILEPDKTHVVEEQARQASEIDIADDDDPLDG